MEPQDPGSRSGSLLVTDFDGTMTSQDFYKLAARSLLPPELPDYWAEYRAGRLTHFQALQAIFASIRADDMAVRAVVEQMDLDPDVPCALRQLERAGWEVVVTSAGCEWYIHILLGEAGVNLPVWSNPGTFEPGRGLLMDLPTSSPFFSPSLGIDKAAVVRHGLARRRRVAFAGDGFPDVDAALLVAAELRFARGDLARVLSRKGLTYNRFERWSEIAEILSRNSPTVPAEMRTVMPKTEPEP
jgi:2,3-diketo-5-methylthio-1-phosphopentane phosphatase